jgi:hypothetical protein
MQPEPCECENKFFVDQGFGLECCLQCGLARRSQMTGYFGFCEQDRLVGHQSYTRLKRFRKYLCRAMRQQSNCSVPRDTWDYLLSKRPFRDARHIQIVLKQARHLKRKCYDSLPFLTSMLCPHVVLPQINEQEKNNAIRMFNVVDNAIREGPFVSYLYCLEYILVRMGRQDVIKHINKIQCPKRRAAYKVRLDEIFEANAGPPITTLLRKHV